MLFIHTSNQLEDLSIEYAKQVRQPLSQVFSSEIVVVQNAGMARYLSMQLANISAISANTEYLFPAEFMWRLLRLVSPDIPETSQCTPETLRFYIMQELSQNSADFPELSHYIDNEANIWNLSGELANLFDKILFYRGEWIQNWEQNPQQESQKNWQARLWIRCVYDNKLKHWLHLQQQFKQNIESVEKAQLPERVSFFSMSSLSPGYLDLIGEVAQIIDIHLFIMNPCEDIYWGDITSEKNRARLPLEKQDYFETGNALLASMGRQGRDFIDQLLNLDQAIEQSVSAKQIQAEEAVNTLLSRLQHDIFTLQQAKPVNSRENRKKVGGCTFNDYKQDDSITFNACHTPMREVEVLYDQILDALNTNPDLTPADIVVMMPDVETYAPYIESIFSANYKHAKSLPFSLADRDPLSVHQLIEALLKTFKLPETHFNVESVFEILDYEAVQSAFDLDTQAIEQCRKLARATNIRWGISAQHRQQNDLPPSDEHTWKYALDRSLLGYSLGETAEPVLFSSKPEQNTSLPLLAYADIEGSDALILSRFKQFSDSLFKISQWPHESHSMAHWLDKTQDLIQTLFMRQETAQQEQATQQDIALILKSIDELRSLTEQTVFELEISFDTFTKSLKEKLQTITGHEKFLGHGITFCAMVPMRSVPFKLVALLGMNDGEYPRQDKQHSFDKVAHKPRRGDRSRRDEDRYLFLESILAARKRLIISYIGQSIRDNSELPPSVLVSELLDSVSIYSGIKPEALICKHPLQAFSPRYFSTGKEKDKDDKKHCSLFSYASEYTRLNRHDSKENVPFIEEPLAPLDKRFKSVSLEELIAFYKNPARTFLQKRFDINTFDEELTLDTREPFEIERFKHRPVRQIIAQAIENAPDNKKLLYTEQIARAQGLLPYGNIGDALFDNEANTVEQFLSQYPLPDELHAISFSLQLDAFELHGSIDNVLENSVLENNQREKHYLSELYAGDFIEVWLTHLALNSQTQASSLIYSPEFSFSLEPVNNPQELLQGLLELYWQGLHYPIPFYPKSAFNLYKNCILKFGSAKPSFYNAKNKWNGGKFLNGESEQFENTLLHQDVDLSDQEGIHAKEFIQYSELFFKPFVTHLREH